MRSLSLAAATMILAVSHVGDALAVRALESPSITIPRPIPDPDLGECRSSSYLASFTVFYEEADGNQGGGVVDFFRIRARGADGSIIASEAFTVSTDNTPLSIQFFVPLRNITSPAQLPFTIEGVDTSSANGTTGPILSSGLGTQNPIDDIADCTADSFFPLGGQDLSGPGGFVAPIADIMPAAVRTQTNMILSQAGRSLSGEGVDLASRMISEEGRAVAVEELIPGGDGAYTYDEVALLGDADFSLNRGLELAQATFPVNFSTGDGPGSFRFWAEAGIDLLDRDAGGFNHDGTVVSVMAGGSYQVDEGFVIGLSLGGEFANIDTAYNNGDLDSVGVIVAPYIAARVFQDLELRATAGYASIEYDASSPTANAEFGSDRFFFAAELGGQVAVDELLIQPAIGLIYASEEVDAFTDSSGAFFPGETLELGRLQANVTVARPFTSEEGTITPFGVARLSYDFTNDDSVAGVAGQLFDDSRTALALGGGVRADLEGGMTVRLEVMANEIGRDDLDDWTLRGGLTMPLN